MYAASQSVQLKPKAAPAMDSIAFKTAVGASIADEVLLFNAHLQEDEEEAHFARGDEHRPEPALWIVIQG